MSRIGSRLALVALFLGFSAIAAAQRSLEEQLPPKPEKYVTDGAGVLGSDRVDALSLKLEQFERDTSNQILVWIDRKIPENFTLEDFAVRAFEKWGVGQQKTDNGAVLFVFVDERKLRIEVGYGLEGVLPDVTANRIIQEEIVPRFRANDYAGGIEAGVDAMIAATRGEYKGSGTTVDERSRGRGGASRLEGCAVPALFVLLFIVLPIMARASRSKRSRTFGGSGWWTGGGGGWGGGWGGGGGGGWSGGGGGFSGGGGSSGGGGASGSW